MSNAYDVFLEEQEKEQRRKDEAAQQFTADLVAILQTESGRRAMKRILASLGYGSYLIMDAAAIANTNFAQGLIAEMLKANEKVTLDIIASLMWTRNKEK